jgi:membrane fusion protein (multidrug efflux system)
MSDTEGPSSRSGAHVKTKRRQWIVTIGGLVLVTAALVGVKAGQIVTMVRAGEAMVPPPEAVTSAVAREDAWERTRPAIGTLVASRAVTVGAELPGTVRQIGFESGATVRRGDLLVKLDTSTEEAQLQAALADQALAHLSLTRARKLREGEANAQADLDAADAKAKQADAAVAQLRTAIDKKTLRAPFDGRVAIRQVELGQVVSPGTPVASLQAVTPIHVDFWLPQQALAELRNGERVELRTDIFQDARWEGEITTINPEVDVASRNVRVRATFPNRDGRLRPGMFGNVTVVSGEQDRVVAIPSTAVIYAPYGDSVFALEQGKDKAGRPATVAKQRFVRLGERRGDLVAVTAGLKAGERIVSTGAFKLRNGVAVAVNDALAPDAKLAPTPPNE